VWIHSTGYDWYQGKIAGRPKAAQTKMVNLLMQLPDCPADLCFVTDRVMDFFGLSLITVTSADMQHLSMAS
jgi:hypothetical protein